MALEWLKTVLGDAYTPEIDKAVAQEIGKSFVARVDFNTKTAKITELETEVKQLREGVKTRDTQLEELKKADGDHADLKQQIETLTQKNKDDKVNGKVEPMKADTRTDVLLEVYKKKGEIYLPPIDSSKDSYIIVEVRNSI